MSKRDGILDGIKASTRHESTNEQSQMNRITALIQRFLAQTAAPFQSALRHLDRITAKVPRMLKTQVIALLILSILGGTVGLTLEGSKNTVRISDGEKVTAFATLESDTDKLLQQVGVELGLDDEVVRSDEQKKNISIEILRAFNVRVVADGKTQSLKMTGGDVSDALAAAGIEAGDKDILSTSINSDLTDNMEIVLQRVVTKMVEAIEAIPFKEEKKYTNTLKKGETKVEREGKNGEKSVVTEQTIVNGKVASSEIVSETVTLEPVNKIVLVGTKETQEKNNTTPPKKPGNNNNNNNNNPAPPKKDPPKKDPPDNDGNNGGNTFKDNKGKTVTYRKLMTGSGTAYTAPKGARTSTGRLAQYGVVAVNPKVIPYGTRMYIASADGRYVYGYCVAGDTGSALRNGSALVDLYYNTYNQCRNFGRRTVKVYIL